MKRVDTLMRTIGVRRLALFLPSISMVIVGSLGLIGEIQRSPTLIAAILATMVVLSFSLGRQSMRLGDT